MKKAGATFRFTHENPMSDWGFALFADNPDHIYHYGDRLYYVLPEDLTNINVHEPEFIEAWENDLEAETLPA
jgi:hypothetical protein